MKIDVKALRRGLLVTIQLRFETTCYTQAATIGVDTGSNVVGIAALTNGEVIVQAEVHIRTNITEKLRQYRRSRRARKTRYREARWANRRRKAVRFVACLLPVKKEPS